jgi:hypothetical protein
MGVWDRVKDKSKPASPAGQQPVAERRPAAPAPAPQRARAPIEDEVDDDHDTVIAPSPFGFDSQLQAPFKTPAPVGEEVSEDEVIDAAAYEPPAPRRAPPAPAPRAVAVPVARDARPAGRVVAAPIARPVPTPAARPAPVRSEVRAVAPVDEETDEELALEDEAAEEEAVTTDAEASTDEGDEMADWLRITQETDWTTITKEERWEKTKEIAQGMDWESYDWKKSPAADFKFPDFTETEMAKKAPWLPKHHNEVGNMTCCHVPDLNQMSDGQQRKMFALYGVPVEWPSKSDEPEQLSELLDELDQARAEGGDTWKEAMDSHGLLNDEHYQWLRHYKLGWSETLAGPGVAEKVAAEIDAAIVEGNAEELLKEHGFRDEAHFQWFKTQVKKAKGKAWAEINVVLQETHKKLDERFEKNKEALKDELAPFKGISMEDWAGANAQLAQSKPLEGILKVLKIERPLWDEVNAEWNARMSRDTTATIATVYGQAFTGAGQGKFGAAGASVSASMKAGSGKDVAGGDPMPFEQWIKIQCHMSAASSQGVDPNAVLKQYQLTAADWGTVGGYWALKMNSNPMEYLEKYSTLSAKYSQQFAAGGAGSDIEF